MLKSVKRLRNYALEHGSIGNNSIQGFADEIEYEVSGWYMPLPVDADGEPFHVGEVAIDYDTPRSIVAVTPDAIVMDGYEDGDSIRMGYAANHAHAKPRTAKDVLREGIADCFTWKKPHSFYDGDDPDPRDFWEVDEAELDKLVGQVLALLGGDAK